MSKPTFDHMHSFERHLGSLVPLMRQWESLKPFGTLYSNRPVFATLNRTGARRTCFQIIPYAASLITFSDVFLTNVTCESQKCFALVFVKHGWDDLSSPPKELAAKLQGSPGTVYTHPPLELFPGVSIQSFFRCPNCQVRVLLKGASR